MTRRSALGAGREKMIPLLTYTTSLDLPADYLKKGCCSPSIAGLPSEYLATRGFHQVAYSRSGRNTNHNGSSILEEAL